MKYRSFSKSYILAALIILAMIPKEYGSEPVHANCCLCMCHAKDETKCSGMCIRLQHSKQIVELPAMDACTKECKRVHVTIVK